MVRKVLVAIVFLIFVTSCKTMNKKKVEEANTFYEAGTAALVQGDYTDALARLVEAVKLDPSNPYYQNNLAFTYQIKKIYDKSEFHFKKALEIKKDFPDAQNNLGVLYIEMGKYKEGIEYCMKAAKNPLYRTPSKAYLNVGRAYYKMKDFKNASKYKRRAVQLDKNFCYAYNSLGMSQIKQKNYKSAGDSLKKAISLCRTYEAPYYVLGLNYVRAGQYDLALKQFNILIRRFPDGRYSARAKQIINTLKK